MDLMTILSFEWITHPEAWITLLILSLLEIVLGVDNIIFINILVGQLPEKLRQKGRIVGLSLAMLMRIMLLLSLSWIMHLVEPLFSIFNHEISGRDLILLGGGLFLIVKSSKEIYHIVFKTHEEKEKQPKKLSFIGIMIEIMILDIVFSLDSVITAVGMSNEIMVMIIAIILAVLIMMLVAKPIGDFVDRNPTVKILALAFLVLVGVNLICESVEIHIPKGYIYFSVLFSMIVELLNIKMRKK